MIMTEAFPLIDVTGSPHERGRQYGSQAASRVRKGIGHYGAQLKRLQLDPAGVASLVHAYLPIIRDFDETYIDEMRGIALGADVPFEDVVLLNARTEILKLAEKPALRAQLIAQDGCTAIAVMPGATVDGRFIHAQNWDWKAECAETAVVLRIRLEDGPDILTFTEAGGLARSGMNAAGIAITANYLQSDRDYKTLGVPLALIRRKVLQQSNLAAAMKAVYATPKSASNNMMVSHFGGICIDFECAPDETFQVHHENGLLVHANHFVSPVALGKLKDLGAGGSGDTLYRDLRVRDLMLPHLGAATVAHVKTALSDSFQSPFSVCRPIRRNTDDNLSATVAMVVMQPEQGLMEVAPLPAHGCHFTSYHLAMESGAFRAAAE
jgi:isopenicillin-N N-acyltransferase-like protein